MTALLDRAFAQVRALPENDQDAFAAVLLSALESQPVTALDDATRDAIRDGVAQAQRGEFASDAEIEALLADTGP